jgi:hypothetical protein
MREDTNTLIERLAHEAKPVKPLRPAALRAGLLIIVIAAAMGALAFYEGNYDAAFASLSSIPYAMELVGAFSTAVLAVVAAIMLSVPGRSESWIYAPLPGIVLWLSGGGIGCARFIDEHGFAQSLFASQFCYEFIVVAGVPAMIAVYLFLRRAVSIHALGVTALGGLGAAMFAAVLLQFMHAHGTSPADFGAHAAAVVTLIVFAVVTGLFVFRRH